MLTRRVHNSRAGMNQGLHHVVRMQPLAAHGAAADCHRGAVLEGLGGVRLDGVMQGSGSIAAGWFGFVDLGLTGEHGVLGDLAGSAVDANEVTDALLLLLELILALVNGLAQVVIDDDVGHNLVVAVAV